MMLWPKGKHKPIQHSYEDDDTRVTVTVEHVEELPESTRQYVYGVCQGVSEQMFTALTEGVTIEKGEQS